MAAKTPESSLLQETLQIRETEGLFGARQRSLRLLVARLVEQPLAKGDDGRPLGNDLRADEVISRLRLELDLERRAKAPGGEIGVDQRPQRKRDTELLRRGFERQDVRREVRPARAVDLVGDARQIEPLLPRVAVRDQVHRIVVEQRVAREIDRLADRRRSEEHTSELQSPCNLVCRLLLEKKKNVTDHFPSGRLCICSDGLS